MSRNVRLERCLGLHFRNIEVFPDFRIVACLRTCRATSRLLTNRRDVIHTQLEVSLVPLFLVSLWIPISLD